MARKKTWYAAGLRFACQPDCGACCTNHGDYSYVYLEGDDLERLAAHVGLDRETFAERYTSQVDGETVLRMDAPECPFLDGWRCSAYAARPRQCRTFPFWEENVATRASWERLRTFCPGVGCGELHPEPLIRLRLAGDGGGGGTD